MYELLKLDLNERYFIICLGCIASLSQHALSLLAHIRNSRTY